MIGHVLNDMNEMITNEYTENHQALDIVSTENKEADIVNLESGIVEEVVKDMPSTDHSTSGLDTYGNYVKIKQNNGKSALYAHMKYGSVNVNKGDYIEKGAIIGTMGATGNAYGNHLHLEIKDENGNHENPIIELNKIQENNKEKKEQVNEEQTNENKQITEEVKEEQIKEENTKTEEKKSEIKETKIQDNPSQTEYLSNQTYKNGSIVDGLKEINIDSSYDYREKLAQKNGIENYRGTYNQNVKLLKLLKTGKLIKA